MERHGGTGPYASTLHVVVLAAAAAQDGSMGSRAHAAPEHVVLAVSCVIAALVALGAGACGTTGNIHDTSDVRGQPCINCHSSAYATAKSPQPHTGFSTSCNDCHSTTSWIPAAGHPEQKFPITTGPHANAGIACTDCHISALGSPSGGANCDCVHCHLGAHTAPGIDDKHTDVGSYPGSASSPPNFCLKCHPSGLNN